MIIHNAKIALTLTSLIFFLHSNPAFTQEQPLEQDDEALGITTAEEQEQLGEKVQWSYYQYNDEEDNNRAVSGIIVGIPETDNNLVDGICVEGTGADFSYVIFGAPINDLKDGAPLSIKFQGDSFTKDMKGTVSSGEEEGVEGILLPLANNDPLWEALKTATSMKYTANDKEINLPLKASAKAIDAFLKDCRLYATQPADQEPPKQQ